MVTPSNSVKFFIPLLDHHLLVGMLVLVHVLSLAGVQSQMLFPQLELTGSFIWNSLVPSSGTCWFLVLATRLARLSFILKVWKVTSSSLRLWLLMVARLECAVLSLIRRALSEHSCIVLCKSLSSTPAGCCCVLIAVHWCFKYYKVLFRNS